MIAIDGPAGAGKSTVAREIAHRFDLHYLDTGAMYRAVTWKLLQENIALSDREAVEKVLVSIRFDFTSDNRILLNGVDVTREIRQPAVNRFVSPVAALPAVRRRMVALQQETAARSGRIIMDGRDIGSRVLPDADFKFYLDAAPEERARRRLKEQALNGIELSFEEVLAEIKERDHIDSTRQDSPLVLVSDAIYIDTTGIPFEEVVEKVAGFITEGQASGDKGS